MNKIVELENNKELVIPNGYNKIFQSSVKHNGIDATLIRYEKDSKTIHYGHANVSFLISKNLRLEGLSWLLPEYRDTGKQLTKNQAESIAVNFLTIYAPDLLDNYKIQWIDRHEEIIDIDEKKTTIAGMKVKFRNIKDGLYFWVIVAPDGSVIIFERDIEWDFIKAGRQTEKWLHDSWLKNKI
ncbi:hypothetical protein OQF52_004955 [Salmonella enterica]|nr:hypothetical protein [Salmonella enterica]